MQFTKATKLTETDVYLITSLNHGFVIVIIAVKKVGFTIVALLLLFQSIVVFAAAPTLDQNEMREVLDIARRIHKLQPNLDEGKYLEYATGIYRASVQYNIEADILLAITKQETSFRDDLPEGAAGELGICQIRKMWATQQDFKKEFPKAKQKDLLRPAKSFMIAAWILRDLKNNSKRSAIPYWSFYNAKRFEPRLKYYTAVSRHLAALNQYDSAVEVVAPKYNPGPSAKSQWTPDPIRFTTVSNDNNEWKPEPIRFKRQRKPASSPETSWISSALKKLQEKKNKNKLSALSDGAIMQAATELNVFKNVFPNQIVND